MPPGCGFDKAGGAQREVAAPTKVYLRVRVEQAVVVVNQVRSVDRSDVPQVRVGQSALRDDGGLLVEVAAELEVEVDAAGEIRRVFGVEDLQQSQVEVLEVGADVVRSVEEPDAVSLETLGPSTHEDPVEGQPLLGVERRVVHRAAPPVFAHGELDRVDVERVDTLVGLDPRLELRPPVSLRRELPVGRIRVGASGQQRLSVADGIARDAHGCTIELQVQHGLRRVAPDASFENQEVRAERSIVEAIEANPALGLEVAAHGLANAQVELGAAFDARRILLEIGIRAHLRNVSARMDLSDPFVLDVPVQIEIAAGVLRLHRIDVDAVVARADLRQERRDVDVLVNEAVGLDFNAQHVFVLWVARHLESSVDLDVRRASDHLRQLRSWAGDLDSGDPLARQLPLDSRAPARRVEVGLQAIVLLGAPEAHPTRRFALE